ncbi:hypothetical protein GRS66_008973 [Saccharomyces pastorianus]|uniref:Eisosome protein seg2 n=1 Tax=Saccharomyces pastorianus TaxID=27292 RepID=A0A6C1EBD4_SACPS|nr:hypothetical protein GRS66_008973 [Saccharomyces pastorianus]
MSRRMGDRRTAQENSPDALAAAAAIGNALSNNGRTVDKSKIPQYNQNFISRTTSIAGIKRYTLTSDHKTSSKAPSMCANTNQFSRRTSSLPNRKHCTTANNSNMRKQHRIHEDAETAFREFGGHESTRILNVPITNDRNSNPRTASLRNSSSIIGTTKKYIPGPRGLVAVEVPVREESPRFSLNSHSRNPASRTYSLPTGNPNMNLMHRKKTTKTVGPQERKPERELKSKSHRSIKAPPKMHAKSSKQNHNDSIPLIQITMNEETEQELKEDRDDPFEFKPMIISDDDFFIESNALGHHEADKSSSTLSGRGKKEQIEKLLEDVHALEAKISNIKMAKSNEEEREQKLILELQTVKVNEERRVEILERELSIAKENADLEAEELKLIELKRQEQLRKEKETKTKTELVDVQLLTVTESGSEKSPSKDAQNEPPNTQNKDEGIDESNHSLLETVDKTLANPILPGSFDKSALHVNSTSESEVDLDSDSPAGSQLSDYNYIEGSTIDLRATAKTSVESEIDTNQTELKFPQGEDFDNTKNHISGPGNDFFSDENKKDFGQEDLHLNDADPESFEASSDTSKIRSIIAENESDVIENEHGNDDDDDDDDDDEEFHDSYDVIVHEPIQVKQTITNVPHLKYSLQHLNEVEIDKNIGQSYDAVEVNQSEANMAKYLRNDNSYPPSMSSGTLELDSQNGNSRSSTETTRIFPSIWKDLPQPAFKSALKKTLATPLSTSSSVYSTGTPPNSNVHIAHTTTSNIKINGQNPPTHDLEQKHSPPNQPVLREIPAMSPRRLEDKRKSPNHLGFRTLRGGSSGAPLSQKIPESYSNPPLSPSYRTTKSWVTTSTSAAPVSKEASKTHSTVSPTIKNSNKIANQPPSNIDEHNSILYPKEPLTKKSSFEKERPMKDNLGFKSMSLRGPLVTKNSPVMRAGSFEAEDRHEQRNHVSRKSWNFSLSSPLKTKMNHSAHPSNEIEKIDHPMSDFKNKFNVNGEKSSVNKRDSDRQNSSLYIGSSTTNYENASEVGTEGHRFSLFRNRSQTSNRNMPAGTTSLNPAYSEVSTALPLSVPVTVIEKNGEIHKLYNDDAAKKDKSHNHHSSHNKFSKKLRKIFGRK